MEYGCIGEKLGHSFSKEIHNRIYDFDYCLKEIPKGELDNFMKERDFKAINVTIPYKQDVIDYLYYISDEARQIGAVNTVVNKNGKLYGYNTDFLGLKYLIEKTGISLKNKKVLILGSGGTSKTAKAVSKSLGAKSVLRVSRRKTEDCIDYNEALEDHLDADIIINTTPCGMYPNISGAAIDIGNFKNLSGVVDAVYNPLNSDLVLSARERGIKASGGLYMLVAQGVFAAEKFLDKEIDKAKIDQIYKSIKEQKENIVLIGMPTSGKSTVGRVIAERLKREFFDTDTLIESKTEKTIPEIFSSLKEEGFRDIEAEVILGVAGLQSAVIATGGGAVLRKENITNLKKNGKVYFLDRPIDKLITTNDRPLSSNKEDLIKRYNERYEIYKNSCHKQISGDLTPEETANIILEDFLNENTCD